MNYTVCVWLLVSFVCVCFVSSSSSSFVLLLLPLLSFFFFSPLFSVVLCLQPSHQPIELHASCMRTVPVAMRSLLLLLKLCTSTETVRRDRAPSFGTLRAVSFTSAFLHVLFSFVCFAPKKPE